MINSNELLKTIVGASKQNINNVKLATVTEVDGGNVYVTYHGETVQSEKPIKRLSSYTASVGDVVMLSAIGGSYIITGKVV